MKATNIEPAFLQRSRIWVDGYEVRFIEDSLFSKERAEVCVDGEWRLLWEGRRRQGQGVAAWWRRQRELKYAVYAAVHGEYPQLCESCKLAIGPDIDLRIIGARGCRKCRARAEEAGMV